MRYKLIVSVDPEILRRTAVSEDSRAMIPECEVGCKICEKSIYRIFVEHVQEHLDQPKKEPIEIERKGVR